ncbi:MAG: hypothetical protein LAO20_20030 [Acidobacteriia bacterium]|nr:hypothetical protein [Terriglobia bacterium]
MLRRAVFLLAVGLVVRSMAAGQEPQSAPPKAPAPDPNVLILKPPEPPPNQPQFKAQLTAMELRGRKALSSGTKLQLIQLMEAEFVHVRKYFPLGDKSIVITSDGEVKPTDANLFQRMQSVGAAAKLGDKVQITNIFFREKTVYVEINGGPKKKSKWYDHISLGMGGPGGMTPTTDPNQAQPTGAAFTLEFKNFVPEMTAEELKALLSPVMDFSIKTAAQVYVESLPPKVQEAVKAHQVLVGMNREMVVMAKDRAPQKIREKDDKGKDYEEWIYGMPPQDVIFVRFVGDEVVQVKTAKMGGEILVKTEKEVDVKDGVTTLAALKASDSPQDKAKEGPEPKQLSHRPTLKREGEGADPAVRQAPPSSAQSTQPSHPDEPEWGTTKPVPPQPPADPKKQPQ